MKKEYVTPEIEMIKLSLQDVILTSTESGISSQIGDGSASGSSSDPFGDLTP